MTKANNSIQKFEIYAVIVTAAGKFFFYDLINQRLIFIILMFGFWGLYVFKRLKDDPNILKTWGFRTDNFNKVLYMVLPYGLTATALCFLIGFIQGTINMHWHIIPVILVYPLFGILQQFLLMSLLAGNIQTMNRINTRTIILLTSVLFGLLHYPYTWLIIGTFVLSLFYTYIFLKERNLFVLGIFHGWLGAIFYYTVVNKDPFLEVFGPLINQ